MVPYGTQLCGLQDGDHFWNIPECYIRGSTIKYIRIPDEVGPYDDYECYKREKRKKAYIVFNSCSMNTIRLSILLEKKQKNSKLQRLEEPRHEKGP
jgi:hypothetical protein